MGFLLTIMMLPQDPLFIGCLREMAQIGLPVLQTLVGAFPITGIALGTAIGGLLLVLSCAHRETVLYKPYLVSK